MQRTVSSTDIAGMRLLVRLLTHVLDCSERGDLLAEAASEVAAAIPRLAASMTLREQPPR